jgi:hypothetical protein
VIQSLPCLIIAVTSLQTSRVCTVFSRPHRIFNEQDGVHRGKLITHGPAHVSVLDASSGQLSLVAPQASIEVGPPSGDQHFRIAHGGAQLGGMLNLSQVRNESLCVQVPRHGDSISSCGRVRTSGAPLER